MAFKLNVFTGTLDVVNKPSDFDSFKELQKEPTGFPNRTDSATSFDNGDRQFTIEPVAGAFDFYVKGKKFTKTTPQSVTIPDLPGNHYIFFDYTGALHSTQVIDGSLFQENALVGIIYWNPEVQEQIYYAEERHGLVMDGATHGYLHNVFGARYLSGFALQGFSVDGSGSFNSHAQFTADSGSIRDEDLVIQAMAQLEIPILYRQGSLWRKKQADQFPVIYSGTAGYSGSQGRLPYNAISGSNWSLQQVPNNSFVLVHFFATNDVNNPVVGIQGINTYISVSGARSGATVEIGSLTGLPFAEFVAIGSVIFETANSYSNTPLARVRATDTGDDYVDFRGTQPYTPAYVTASSHGLLSNLSSDDHLQYLTNERGDVRYYTKPQVDDFVDDTNDRIDQEIIDRQNADASNSSRISSLENFLVDQVFYVAKNGSDTTGTGGQHKPFLTISKALSMISDATPSKRYVVRVFAGNYTEPSISVPANVFVVGESKESVRITGPISMDSSFNANSSFDNRSGFSMVSLLSSCDFNWSTVQSAAGKMYFNEVVFASSVNMYGYNNAIAQAQFDSCIVFGALTVSGINVGVFNNNICYSNITLNQHPGGGMPTLINASGGYCLGTIRHNTSVADFNRRCASFLSGFRSENLIIDGPSSYCDFTIDSGSKNGAQVLNGGNLVPMNKTLSQGISPNLTNTHNAGDWGKQWFFNFAYVHASSGTDLYLTSAGDSYDPSGDSSGKSINIESDGYGLKPNVSGGDISLLTATTSGSGVRGKIKLDAREIDTSNKKIVNLANGVSPSDAINKGQLDSAIGAVNLQISALQSDQLECIDETFVLSGLDVSNGYIDLAVSSVLTNSITLFIGRLAFFQGDDFTVGSAPSGKVRVTFTAGLMSSAEAPESGDILRVKYFVKQIT